MVCLCIWNDTHLPTHTGPIIAFISARVSEAEMFTLRYSEVLLIIVVYV